MEADSGFETKAGPGGGTEAGTALLSTLAALPRQFNTPHFASSWRRCKCFRSLFQQLLQRFKESLIFVKWAHTFKRFVLMANMFVSDRRERRDDVEIVREGARRTVTGIVDQNVNDTSGRI